MPRAKKSTARRQKHKRILNRAKGFYGARSRAISVAKPALMKAGMYAWRDRRARKRDMRRLWITRITAACRMRGTRYSLFINGLKFAGILLNRKMLSLIAIEDPATFDRLVEAANKATTATPAKA
ncbi:MAG TPA: 50S ribosomal protein L20 [Phycisphaerales bacterium]|nr:50S ribosomal protein L20 [Phycisphaerales bacterium]